MKHSLYIFLSASCTVIVGGAMSGWGVITRTTLHRDGSSPAAITRRTTSLLVKIPAMRGGVPGTPVFSITQTAVVRFSFMILAASLTVVFGPTVAGCVRESITVVKSGSAVFSRRASTYASIAAACGFAVMFGPNSACTPVRAE